MVQHVLQIWRRLYPVGYINRLLEIVSLYFILFMEAWCILRIHKKKQCTRTRVAVAGVAVAGVAVAGVGVVVEVGGGGALAAVAVRARGHAEVGRELRGVGAARARRRAAPLGPHAAPPHVLVAEARLAAQARVLPESVARLALVRLRLQHLARRLVLELVVLAQESRAEAAPEHAPAVLPHTCDRRLCNHLLDDVLIRAAILYKHCKVSNRHVFMIKLCLHIKKIIICIN